MAQSWPALRQELASVSAIQTANLAHLKQANALQTQLQNDTVSFSSVGDKLRQTYDAIEAGSAREEAAVGRALVLAGQAIEQKRAPPAVEPEKRKKRKLSAEPSGSGVPSPAPSAVPVPKPVVNVVTRPLVPPTRTATPHIAVAPPQPSPAAKPAPAAQSQKLAVAPPSAPPAGQRRGSKPPSSPRPPAVVLLEPDRKVAFKQNVDDEPVWVLGRIVKVLDADKQRYEVQDDEPEEGTEEVKCLNIRSIIPLPDPARPETYPALTPGASVLAMYPETTTFYKGKVVASPNVAPGQSAKRGAGADARNYKIVFVDDGGKGKAIVPELVISDPN